MQTDPTKTLYEELSQAYEFFNSKLFEGRLPPCLITMRRRRGEFGYFAPGRFGTRDGTQVTDEIALNPNHFRTRTTEHILSTLVHEMTHLQQFHLGKPSRGGYHNKQWAGMMRAVGLIPSDNGHHGGKETGQRVSHYIELRGPFDRACAELLGSGVKLPFVDLWAGRRSDAALRRKKATSKTKYTCPGCGTNAWAKPAVRLICGDCDTRMLARDLYAFARKATGVSAGERR